MFLMVAVGLAKRPPYGNVRRVLNGVNEELFPDSRQRPLGQSAGGHNDPLPQLQQVSNEDNVANDDNADNIEAMDNGDSKTMIPQMTATPQMTGMTQKTSQTTIL